MSDKQPDINDRLKAGTLDTENILDGAVPANEVAKKKHEETPRVFTMQRILDDSMKRAFSREERKFCTLLHWKLDFATGGMRPGQTWLFGADTNWGKCLGKDTQVKRSNGANALAQDIVVGDQLMGPDSKPRTVLSTTRGKGELYTIRPKRGKPWVCNWAHILVVVHTGTGVVTEISVEEFLKKPPSWQFSQKIFHVGTEFPRQPPPSVDPWFLGVWYGDGTKDLRGVSVTTPDAEVISGLQDIATQWGMHLGRNEKKGSKAATYRIAGTRQESAHGNLLIRAMREIYLSTDGLPDCVMRGSRDVRLEFLAGLIDSDGYKKDECHCEIVTKSKQWSEDIISLSRSLGIQAFSCEKTGVKGYDDRVYYRVNLGGDLSVIPTRIERKKFTEPNKKDMNRVGFTIEPAGVGEFFGWELDQDGLFLLGDFTVTHNSSLLIGICDENMRLGKRPLIVSSEDDENVYGDRFMLRRSRVNATRLRDARLTDEEMNAVADVASRGEKKPIFLCGRGKTAEVMCKQADALIKSEGIDLIFFDYIQEFRTDKQFKDERLMYKAIGSMFRNVIKGNQITGMIMSQLTNPDGLKAPNKSMIRECKDLANAAEYVALGYTATEAIRRPFPDGRPDPNGEILIEAGAKVVKIDKGKDGNKKIAAMKWDTNSNCFDVVSIPPNQYDDLYEGFQDGF